MSSKTPEPAPGMAHFFSLPYQQHNRARLQHLESLGLPLGNARVLELGSGPGDHTQFYVDRNCTIVSVDARQECLDALAERFPHVRTIACDLNEPEGLGDIGVFDVVHCYGVLYHLEAPARLIAHMGEVCAGFAVVETCVSREEGGVVEGVAETAQDYTQSATGRASRPSRRWVFERLRERFPFVYQTRTQPAHPEFPLRWDDLEGAPPLIRAVFVASKFPLELPSLSSQLLSAQFPSTVEELQARLDAMQRLVWQYDSELRSKEEVLSELRREAQARLEALEDAAGRAARLEASASERLKAVAEKDGTISRLDAQAAGLRAQLEAAAASNEELREQAARLEATAAERLEAMLEKERLIAELDAALKRR
jgi:SAM-dependent methyltransferase